MTRTRGPRPSPAITKPAMQSRGGGWAHSDNMVVLTVDEARAGVTVADRRGHTLVS